LVADDERDSLLVGEDDLYFVEGLKISQKLVHGIEDLYIILVGALLILFISFLEGDNNKIVISELFDYLFAAFDEM
jgi:hypothetical protein